MTHLDAVMVEALEAYVRTGSISAAARELDCHPQTVKARLQALRETLGVTNTTQACYLGRLDGWLVVRELDAKSAA